MKEFTLFNSKEEVMRFLPDRVIKKIQLGSVQVAGLRIGENVHVFEVFCPHRGASLLQASVNGSGQIICPLHEYRFDLKTGNVKAGYCSDLIIYQAQVSETGLKITLP